MRAALRLQGVAITVMLLVTPILRVGADLVIGTVVDVNMMQTERQDFEEGWGEWSESNMELVDTSDVSDAKVILLIGVGNGWDDIKKNDEGDIKNKA